MKVFPFPNHPTAHWAVIGVPETDLVHLLAHLLLDLIDGIS